MGSLGLLRGNGGKRWVWGSRAGETLGDKGGGKIAWGSEKENGKRSQHSKEVGVVYDVSFLVNFSAGVCRAGGRAEQRGAAGVAEGQGMVPLCFCHCSFALFSIEPVLLKLCIRKKEVSINFCEFFCPWGTLNQGFNRIESVTSHFIPWQEKRHNWTSQPFGCPSRMTLPSLRNRISYCPFAIKPRIQVRTQMNWKLSPGTLTHKRALRGKITRERVSTVGFHLEFSPVKTQ